MHTHRERALTTIALVNKNSTLTSNLEDTEEHLHAMIAQNISLQRQFVAASNNWPSQEQDNDITMEEEGPAVLRGGGDQGYGSEDKLSDLLKEDCAPTGGTAQGFGSRVQSTGLGQGSGTSPRTFIQAQQYFAGHRPSSGPSITKLHDSVTNTQQDVDTASKGGSEELSL
jgi:hypothetical protein